jgi:hypothetical protein
MTVGLIALCIIGIIIPIIFMIINKRKKSGNGSQPTANDTSGKKKKTKGVKQDPKYSAVPPSDV